MEQEKKMTVTVELKTALLKGYSHSGHMAKADALFQQMCVAGGKMTRKSEREQPQRRVTFFHTHTHTHTQCCYLPLSLSLCVHEFDVARQSK